jgi:hypothetical protein
MAFKLKQFAASMPTEIKEVHQRVSGSVSLEWEAAIRKAYGQVAPASPETSLLSLGATVVTSESVEETS